MNNSRHHLHGAFLVLGLVLGLAAGCGGEDGGGDRDYTGNWLGTTSNGGTVSFSVANDLVTPLRLTDPQGSLWLTLQVEINGNSFRAEHVESPNDQITLQCTFDSATHGSGRYTMRDGGQSLNGTFEVARQ